jgi:hypothetical protein
MADKKRKVKISADRLAMMRKTKKAAGKSKSDYDVRVAQNKGVKDGEIRLGKNGKSYNIWDAKSGRWVKGQVKAEASDSPSARPTASRVSPSARGEGSSRKPNRTTTYNPGAGAARPKTPGDKFFDSARRAIEVRGGNAAKTRGRDAIVKAGNKGVADKRQAARKRREEALKAAVEARAERMRGYR